MRKKAPFLFRVARRPGRPNTGEYPYSIPAIAAFESLELDDEVTFFVGENGAGKSTLLEAIAIAWGFNPEGGTRNSRFVNRPSESPLCDDIQLIKSGRLAANGFFLRAESFFDFATYIDGIDDLGDEEEDDENLHDPPLVAAYGGRSLHEQSHGESFFALLTHRFGANGLYLLDEPEAALSANRQIQFLDFLDDRVARGCQFVIATHSPIILAWGVRTAKRRGRIYRFGPPATGTDEPPLAPIDYEASDPYRRTREFLAGLPLPANTPLL